MKNASFSRLPVMAAFLGLSLTVATTSVFSAQDKKNSDKHKASANASPSASASPAAKSSSIPLKDPVATVDGQKITKAELLDAFNKEVQAANITADTLSADQKLAAYHQIVDALITDKLVEKQSAGIEVPQADIDAEFAKIKGQFKSDKEFNDYLKRFNQTPDGVKKEIKSALQWKKWVDGKVAGKNTVDEKDVRKFYDENTKEFENPEMVRASHILFLVPEGASPEVVKQKKEAAQKALARIQKGEDFATVAKELSEDPGSKDKGGDLEFFARDHMVKEFSDVAFTEKVGDVSAPVRTQYGYHIIKVTDKRPAGTIPYDEIKARLTTYLENQKSRDAVRQVIDDLRSKAKVQVNLPEQKTPPAAPGSASMPEPAQQAPGN